MRWRARACGLSVNITTYRWRCPRRLWWLSAARRPLSRGPTERRSRTDSSTSERSYPRTTTTQHGRKYLGGKRRLFPFVTHLPARLQLFLYFLIILPCVLGLYERLAWPTHSLFRPSSRDVNVRCGRRRVNILHALEPIVPSARIIPVDRSNHSFVMFLISFFSLSFTFIVLLVSRYCLIRYIDSFNIVNFNHY